MCSIALEFSIVDHLGIILTTIYIFLYYRNSDAVVRRQMWNINFALKLDSNRRPMVMEVPAMISEPKQLYIFFYIFPLQLI